MGGAIKRRPEEIKGVIERVLGRLEGVGKAEEKDILSIWECAVGKRAARHTQPASLRKGILTVAVDGSAWLYQLTMEKRGLLEGLRAKLGQKIDDIKFRIK